MKVLFIGNSYTYYNDMPAMFEAIAASAGQELSVSSVTKGGYSLNQFASVSDPYGAEADAALKAATYDYVILQEQSCLPALNPSVFYDGVRLLYQKVQDNGAKCVLYATWGRKTGSPELLTNGWTNESMTMKLFASYQTIADELGIVVSPVGLAFYDVYTHYPEIELYDPDMSHPSAAGSYLAALTHYSVIFVKSPIGIPYKANADEATAVKLQKAAHNAALGTPSFQ